MLNRNRTITQYLHNAPESTVLTQGIYGGKYFCMVMEPTLASYLIEAWTGKKGYAAKMSAIRIIETLTWLPITLTDSVVYAEELVSRKLDKLVFCTEKQHWQMSMERYQELVYKYITEILGASNTLVKSIPSDLTSYDLVLREHREGTDLTLSKYLQSR